MYRSAAEVWAGLSKNATEGMASPAVIVPWTVLLLGGHVLPPALLLATLGAGTADRTLVALCVAAWVASYAVRLTAARRFRQSRLGALLHPLGVLVLVVIQWAALLRRAFGRPSSWRGRTYDVGAKAAANDGAAAGAGEARPA
jgi:hypothetical protein